MVMDNNSIRGDFVYRVDKYEKIINIICYMKGIEENDLCKILKDKDYKYLLFLFLKKYKCDNLDRINRDFFINNKKIVNYNFKKAQEKLLINSHFREIYFEIEKEIEKWNKKQQEKYSNKRRNVIL